MINNVLVQKATKRALATENNHGGVPTLLTQSYGSMNGSFKAATRASAGTTIIAEPKGSDAICLTDLILTTDKVNAATVTVHITDGTNTIVLIAAVVTDSPCNIAIPFQGNWTGWQGARFELITVGTVKATCALGYHRIAVDVAMPFGEWDAQR